uniref:protein acetyllysine N-acetyltransferase n=1 Tax=Panstrongylus lignarius TaxID=156445 RepID=A0A224XN22_9HEMI
MSCNYSDGLSSYENKGKVGLKEIFEPEENVIKKVKELAKWINSASHVVVHTGAGISTSAGIPDFRGPNGVWTLEKQGLKPSVNISFDDAVPTNTHMALLEMINAGKIHYIVSQNIDGLHLRSGLPRGYISELHGNIFTEQCNVCKRQFVRKSATISVGQKCLNVPCPSIKVNSRSCRGKMYDTILDWEHDLPEKDLKLADYHSSIADLSICLGTTLQIVPSGNLPLYTKRNGTGKLVICNLQPTKHDRKADLILNTYVDDVMSKLLEHLHLKLPAYNVDNDPTKNADLLSWTISDSNVKQMQKIYQAQYLALKRKSSISYEKVKMKKKENTTINVIL